MATETDINGTDSSAQSPEAVGEQIEQTRSQLSATLDAIQAKLDPERLKAQAVETIKETAEHAKEQVVQTARDATREAVDSAHDATIGRAEEFVHHAGDTAAEVGYTMLDSIKHNPVPAALTALGVGWLLMENRGPSAPERERYSRPERREYYDSRGEAHGFWHGTRDIEEEDFADRLPGPVSSLWDNPIPTALAAAGIGWLLMGGSGGNSRQRQRRAYQSQAQRGGRYYRPEERGYADEARARADQVLERAQGVAEQARNQAGHLADEVKDTLGQAQAQGSQLKDEAGQALHQVQDQAGQVLHGVQDQAGELVDDAQQAASRALRGAEELGHEATRTLRRAPSRLEELVNENPLLVGALALAVGAAIGGSLPGTRYEDEVFGSKRDEWVGKAQQRAGEALHQAQVTAHQTVDKVQQVAGQAVDSARTELQTQLGGDSQSVTEGLIGTVKSAAAAAVHAAKESADEQGLTHGDLSLDKVKHVAQESLDAAKSEATSGDLQGIARDAGDAVKAAAQAAQETIQEETDSQDWTGSGDSNS